MGKIPWLNLVSCDILEGIYKSLNFIEKSLIYRR